jgi:hypothetical protein
MVICSSAAATACCGGLKRTVASALASTKRSPLSSHSTDHTLWRETGESGNRVEVDHAVKDFQAINVGLIYVLSADGQLWREAGSAQARMLVAGNIAAFQYFASGERGFCISAREHHRDVTIGKPSHSAGRQRMHIRGAGFAPILRWRDAGLPPTTTPVPRHQSPRHHHAPRVCAGSRLSRYA